MRKLMYAATAAFALSVAVAGTAAAAQDPTDTDGVDVTVSIPQPAGPGTLALTVAGGSATLTENGSTGTVRTFTGQLPRVTVTDTRPGAADADWYVMGTASTFTSPGGATITADHLGWSPRLVSGTDESTISVGGDVGTSLDSGPDNRGLVDQELLYSRDGTTASSQGGVWTAGADLTLDVPSSVTPGDYSSVLTLSLFE